MQLRSGTPEAEIEFDDGGVQFVNTGWIQGVADGGLDPDLFILGLNEGDTAFVSLDLAPDRDGGRPAGLLLGVPGSPALILADDSNTGATTPNSEAAFVTVLDGGFFAVGVNPPTASGLAVPYRLSYSVFPKGDESRCTTYVSQDPAQAIGDGGVGITTSTVTVTNAAEIDQLEVLLDLEHANMQDLDVQLTSPEGNVVGLFSDIGNASFPRMNVRLADDGALPISATTLVSGMVSAPELNYRLEWFRGQSAQGTWTLTVRDDTAAAAGVLQGFGVRVCRPARTNLCPAGSGQRIITSTDFEADEGGFTHGGVVDQWARGLPAVDGGVIQGCGSGVNCFKTNLLGNYLPGSNQTLQSAALDTSTVSPTSQLWVSWKQRYQIESASFDRLLVRAVSLADAGTLPDGGAIQPPAVTLFQSTGSTMNDTVGSPSVIVQESTGWGIVRANATALVGAPSTALTFNVQTDSSVNLNGVAIDDVVFAECTFRCGDGAIYGPSLGGTEQCDDSNTNNNDGCSSTCQLESVDAGAGGGAAGGGAAGGGTATAGGAAGGGTATAGGAAGGGTATAGGAAAGGTATAGGAAGGAGGGMSGSGCGCNTSNPTDALPFALLLGLVALRRRRTA